MKYMVLTKTWTGTHAASFKIFTYKDKSRVLGCVNRAKVYVGVMQPSLRFFFISCIEAFRGVAVARHLIDFLASGYPKCKQSGSTVLRVSACPWHTMNRTEMVTSVIASDICARRRLTVGVMSEKDGNYVRNRVSRQPSV